MTRFGVCQLVQWSNCHPGLLDTRFSLPAIVSTIFQSAQGATRNGSFTSFTSACPPELVDRYASGRHRDS